MRYAHNIYAYQVTTTPSFKLKKYIVCNLGIKVGYFMLPRIWKSVCHIRRIITLLCGLRDICSRVLPTSTDEWRWNHDNEGQWRQSHCRNPFEILLSRLGTILLYISRSQRNLQIRRSPATVLCEQHKGRLETFNTRPRAQQLLFAENMPLLRLCFQVAAQRLRFRLFPRYIVSESKYVREHVKRSLTIMKNISFCQLSEREQYKILYLNNLFHSILQIKIIQILTSFH